MPDQAAAGLPALLDGLDPRPGRVRGEEGLARRIAAAPAGRRGERPVRLVAERLYRLAALKPPDPAPPGRARAAAPDDRDLLLRRLRAFHAEIGDGAAVNERHLDARVADGRLVLWEVDGQPVSMAARTATVAGSARIGPVYTPAGPRGRGCAGAAVAAAVRCGPADGPRETVLFADRGNPTSNALYERLGFVPAEDCAVFACEAGAAGSG